jgi:hypothetical protein
MPQLILAFIGVVFVVFSVRILIRREGLNHTPISS